MGYNIISKNFKYISRVSIKIPNRSIDKTYTYSRRYRCIKDRENLQRFTFCNEGKSNWFSPLSTLFYLYTIIYKRTANASNFYLECKKAYEFLEVFYVIVYNIQVYNIYNIKCYILLHSYVYMGNLVLSFYIKKIL